VYYGILLVIIYKFISIHGYVPSTSIGVDPRMDGSMNRSFVVLVVDDGKKASGGSSQPAHAEANIPPSSAANLAATVLVLA